MGKKYTTVASLNVNNRPIYSISNQSHTRKGEGGEKVVNKIGVNNKLYHKVRHYNKHASHTPLP